MPLKYQILLPMMLVTLATVAGLSVFSAVTAGKRARALVERRVSEVAGTLDPPAFRLTPAVLRQMKGLTGADFLRTDHAGDVLASTLAASAGVPESPAAPETTRISIGSDRYFATRIDLVGSQGEQVHLLFPESAYVEQWQQAFWPPMVVGVLALAAVATLAVVIHRRLSRPLEQLQVQVGRIAEGDYAPLPLPARRDEIHSLGESVNRMAQRLSDSEQQVRRSERLRTLGQLGGGIAHHLRNSATGARIALDLHRRSCQTDPDSLDVAERQLTLMESYLQRFLSIGAEDAPAAIVDLRELLLGLEVLVQPAAAHVRVELTVDAGTEPAQMMGDSSSLEQMLVNLLLNAVEAAADGRSTEPRQVAATLRQTEGRAEIVVEDTGLGPSPAVADQLFEPFVTDRADGVGLGLAVAHQAAVRHQGSIRWERSDGRTKFIVRIPLKEADRVAAADR